MKYILWVVLLLEAFDVTNNGRHLGFYQELEIRLKPREMVMFCALHEKKNTQINTLHDFSHKIYMLFTGLTLVGDRIGRNCTRGLEYRPTP